MDCKSRVIGNRPESVPNDRFWQSQQIRYYMNYTNRERMNRMMMMEQPITAVMPVWHL